MKQKDVKELFKKICEEDIISYPYFEVQLEKYIEIDKRIEIYLDYSELGLLMQALMTAEEDDKGMGRSKYQALKNNIIEQAPLL